jgi:hypothetical protein
MPFEVVRVALRDFTLLTLPLHFQLHFIFFRGDKIYSTKVLFDRDYELMQSNFLLGRAMLLVLDCETTVSVFRKLITLGLIFSLVYQLTGLFETLSSSNTAGLAIRYFQ